MFNEGYLATSRGDLVRVDIVSDALRLARGLSALLPNEPEPMGLLALMLLHDSRRESRVSDAGELVLLEDQDRSKWKRSQIEEGIRLVEQALRMGRPGPYQIQGAIAAVHADCLSPRTNGFGSLSSGGCATLRMLADQLYDKPRLPAVSSHRRIIAYWVTTALLASELLLGGIWDVLRVPQVLGIIHRLGYPSYFLVILGIWKLLGAVALIVPRFPRLKEWAYAGAIFDLTGAVLSQLAAGLIDVGQLIYPIVMTGVAIMSWALRPPSRRLSSRQVL